MGQTTRRPRHGRRETLNFTTSRPNGWQIPPHAKCSISEARKWPWSGWNICYLMDLYWLSVVLVDECTAVEGSSTSTRTQLLFSPEQKGSISLRNGGFNIHIYTMSKPKRLTFEQYPKWHPDKESNVTQVKDGSLWRLREEKSEEILESWNETLHLLHGETEFVALKIGRQYPHVLLVRLGWGQVTLGSEKGKVTGDGIVFLYCRGKKVNNGANFEHSLIVNFQYM